MGKKGKMVPTVFAVAIPMIQTLVYPQYVRSSTLALVPTVFLPPAWAPWSLLDVLHALRVSIIPTKIPAFHSGTCRQELNRVRAQDCLPYNPQVQRADRFRIRSKCWFDDRWLCSTPCTLWLRGHCIEF